MAPPPAQLHHHLSNLHRIQHRIQHRPTTTTSCPSASLTSLTLARDASDAQKAYAYLWRFTTRQLLSFDGLTEADTEVLRNARAIHGFVKAEVEAAKRREREKWWWGCAVMVMVLLAMVGGWVFGRRCATLRGHIVGYPGGQSEVSPPSPPPAAFTCSAAGSEGEPADTIKDAWLAHLRTHPACNVTFTSTVPTTNNNQTHPWQRPALLHSLDAILALNPNSSTARDLASLTCRLEISGFSATDTVILSTGFSCLEDFRRWALKDGEAGGNGDEAGRDSGEAGHKAFIRALDFLDETRTRSHIFGAWLSRKGFWGWEPAATSSPAGAAPGSNRQTKGWGGKWIGFGRRSDADAEVEEHCARRLWTAFEAELGGVVEGMEGCFQGFVERAERVGGGRRL